MQSIENFRTSPLGIFTKRGESPSLLRSCARSAPRERNRLPARVPGLQLRFVYHGAGRNVPNLQRVFREELSAPFAG